MMNHNPSSPTNYANYVHYDVKWIEGLRGIAAFAVVSGHVFVALWPILRSPTQSYHGSSLLLQLPFVRLLLAGRVSIAVFALITGYVNTLKPIRFMRTEENDRALVSIASSAFRRTGRLVLPTSIATVIAWFLAQIGAFEVSLHANQPWLRDISPRRSVSFSQAISSLAKNLATTWTTGENDYDKIQWTITFFLQAAWWTHSILLATIYVKPKYRLLIYCGLYGYFWYARNPLIGINICFGMLMADFTQSPVIHEATSKWRRSITIGSLCMIALGLYICSFPEDHSGWTSWSNRIAGAGNMVLPRNGELSRYVHSVGAQVFMLGIQFSDIAKKVLSHDVLVWMGKTSFAVYLIHPLFIRTVLVWVMYGSIALPQDYDEHGKPLEPGILIWGKESGVTFTALALFYVVVYVASNYWTLHVEAWCLRVLDGLEALVFRKSAPQAKSKQQLLPK